MTVTPRNARGFENPLASFAESIPSQSLMIIGQGRKGKPLTARAIEKTRLDQLGVSFCPSLDRQQIAVLGIAHDLGDPADGSRNDRHAEGERFAKHKPIVLRTRGYEEHISLKKKVGHEFVLGRDPL